MSFCPDFVCLDSFRCPDFVRNFRKNAVRCPSVRPDKDETELSGFSVSLSADVCLGVSLLFLAIKHDPSLRTRVVSTVTDPDCANVIKKTSQNIFNYDYSNHLI